MFQRHLAALLVLGAPLLSVATLQQPAPQAATQDTTGAPVDSTWTPAPLSVEEIDTLVAPLALYPDKLVAQVLAASTWRGARL